MTETATGDGLSEREKMSDDIDYGKIWKKYNGMKKRDLTILLTEIEVKARRTHKTAETCLDERKALGETSRDSAFSYWQGMRSAIEQVIHKIDSRTRGE